MTPEKTGKGPNRKRLVDVRFWISIYRGILSLVLGVFLLSYPEKTGGMLFNMMGLFWLMSGITLIRQGADLELEKKVSWVATIWALIFGVFVTGNALYEKIKVSRDAA